LVKVILVRHGETDWNLSRRIQGGNSDTPLNQRGWQQAEGLALRLKQEKIQAIYSSPLQRARDTAQAIARYHQLLVEIEPSLKEIEVGELEGVSITEVGKHLSELLVKHKQGEELPRIPGGESVFVVVAHYFTVLTAICAVLNLPLAEIDRLRLSSSGISIINFDGQTPRLMLFNDTCHLANIE